MKIADIIFKPVDLYFDGMKGQPVPWRIITLATLAVVYFPLYIVFNVDSFLFGSDLVTASGPQGYVHLANALLYFHVAAAVPPLLIGPWMFHAGFRGKFPQWHRRFGKIYIYTCLFSAITSLPLSLQHSSGLIPSIGFSSLAVSWYSFTVIGYFTAMRKNFTAHRRWMMRSYACTFAFVNVKFYYFVSVLTGIYPDPMTAKVMQSGISWTSNLLIVEIWLLGSTFTGKFIGWKKLGKNLLSF